LFRHVSASVLGRLQGPRGFLRCAAYVSLISQQFKHINKVIPNNLTYQLNTWKKHELPEDGQDLRPKHVGPVINK